MTTVSLAELLARGVAVQPREAVAIAQELTVESRTRTRAAPPSSGPLTPDTVHLDRDGSVVQIGSAELPGLSEVAQFLQTLLGSAAKVPGALRYTVARALLEVDAPPFESLADFSRTLTRFEPSDRRGALRDLFERYTSATKAESTLTPSDSSRKGVPPEVTVSVPLHARRSAAVQMTPTHDRRRIPAQVAALRRQLREADQRLFEQQVASRKSARVVKMPALSVVAGASVIRAASNPRPAESTREGVNALQPRVVIPSTAAPEPDMDRAAGPGHSRYWVRALAFASAAAAVVSLVVAGLSHIHQVGSSTNSPASVSHVASAPAVSRAATRDRSAVRALPAPARTGNNAISPTVVDSAAATASQKRPIATSAAVLDSPHPVRSTSRVAGVVLAANVSESTDGGDDGSMVSALDSQRRPVFSPAFASKESAMFSPSGRSGGRQGAINMGAAADNASDFEVMTILDDGARNYHAQPSPDGQQVAFDSDRDGERGVYLVNRDGTNARRVSGSGYAAFPEWSPDGSRLAYVRAEPDNPQVWNLWLLSLGRDAAGKAGDAAVRKLTNYAQGQTWAASWFSDGRRICYAHEDKIVVLDLSSGRSREFESPLKGRRVRTPAVSPDGSRVIFQVFRGGAWLLDLADGSMQCVLTDPSAEEFAWAPGGRRIAYHSRRNGAWGIYYVHAGN